MRAKPFLVIAAALAAAGGTSAAHAKSPPSPAEVSKSWKKYLTDSGYNHFRAPTSVRNGSEVTIWQVSIPLPSMAELGVPTLYQRVTYDCVGKRKKIMEITRLKADGSVQPPPEKDVKLDRWTPTMGGSDFVLQTEVCA
jgi:hypothetical protein